MHPIRALYENRAGKGTRPALFDGAVTLTHDEVIERVERAARGVLAGGRVGLCAANTWRHVIAYLAILRAGAVWVPLNPRNGARLNDELRARVKTILTEKAAPAKKAKAGSASLLVIAKIDSDPGSANRAFAKTPAAMIRARTVGGARRCTAACRGAM